MAYGGGLNSTEYQRAAADMAYPTHSAQQVSGVTRDNTHIHGLQLIRQSLLLREAVEQEVMIYDGPDLSIKGFSSCVQTSYILKNVQFYTW